MVRLQPCRRFLGGRFGVKQLDRSPQHYHSYPGCVELQHSSSIRRAEILWRRIRACTDAVAQYRRSPAASTTTALPGTVTETQHDNFFCSTRSRHPRCSSFDTCPCCSNTSSFLRQRIRIADTGQYEYRHPCEGATYIRTDGTRRTGF